MCHILIVLLPHLAFKTLQDSDSEQMAEGKPPTAFQDMNLSCLICREIIMQVAQGHGLLAELLQTSKNLPKPLIQREVISGKFAPVLFDYAYFKGKASIEKKIEDSTELQQLDDQLISVSLPILSACPYCHSKNFLQAAPLLSRMSNFCVSHQRSSNDSFSCQY